jgi:hypothetical protein
VGLLVRGFSVWLSRSALTAASKATAANTVLAATVLPTAASNLTSAHTIPAAAIASATFSNTTAAHPLPSATLTATAQSSPALTITSAPAAAQPSVLPTNPPTPTPLPPPAPAMPCSEMIATLTNLRASNEWCNTDAARRNPIDCPQFYAELDNGHLIRCAYDAVDNACTLRNGQVCVADLPPDSPLPAPAAAMPCSAMIETLTNTQTLDPPEWCNADPARRNPEECSKFCASTSDGKLQRCGYDLVGNRCRLSFGQVCIQAGCRPVRISRCAVTVASNAR